MLLAHLLLFEYVYPGAGARIPRCEVSRLRDASTHATIDPAICRGTLLSRAQYLWDVTRSGRLDPRLPPLGRMSRRDYDRWTDAIPQRLKLPGQ